MKKIFSIIICLVLILMISLLNIHNKKDEDKSLTKIKVAEVTHSVFYAPWYVAIENNYFKDEGLDIELILTPGADKVAAAVLSNDVNIGFAGLESTIYVYNGGEADYLVNFAGLTKRDGQFILSRSKNDNFNLEELYGKEVLVGRKGGMPALNFLNALKKMNIDSSKINLNYSVEFAALSGSFIGGMGDYVNLFEPTATKLEKENLGYVVASIGAYSGEMPYTTYYARKSYIENNKDIIDKFKKALNKGLEFVNNNEPDVVAEVIHNQFKDESLNNLTTMIKRYKDYDCWYDDTHIKEIAYQNLEQVMLDNNLIEKKVDFKTLVNNN